MLELDNHGKFMSQTIQNIKECKKLHFLPDIKKAHKEFKHFKALTEYLKENLNRQYQERRKSCDNNMFGGVSLKLKSTCGLKIKKR